MKQQFDMDPEDMGIFPEASDDRGKLYRQVFDHLDLEVPMDMTDRILMAMEADTAAPEERRASPVELSEFRPKRQTDIGNLAEKGKILVGLFGKYAASVAACFVLSVGMLAMSSAEGRQLIGLGSDGLSTVTSELPVKADSGTADSSDSVRNRSVQIENGNQEGNGLSSDQESGSKSAETAGTSNGNAGVTSGTSGSKAGSSGGNAASSKSTSGTSGNTGSAGQSSNSADQAASSSVTGSTGRSSSGAGTTAAADSSSESDSSSDSQNISSNEDADNGDGKQNSNAQDEDAAQEDSSQEDSSKDKQGGIVYDTPQAVRELNEGESFEQYMNYEPVLPDESLLPEGWSVCSREVIWGNIAQVTYCCGEDQVILRTSKVSSELDMKQGTYLYQSLKEDRYLMEGDAENAVSLMTWSDEDSYYSLSFVPSVEEQDALVWAAAEKNS